MKLTVIFVLCGVLCSSVVWADESVGAGDVEYVEDYEAVELFDDTSSEPDITEEPTIEPSSSTMPPTTPSTASTTTATPSPDSPVTPPTPQPPNLGNGEVKVDLVMEIDAEFSANLEDETSAEYIAMVNQVKKTVNNIFITSAGFKEVRVLGFRNGSIIADTQMIYDLSVSTTNGSDVCSGYNNSAENLKTGSVDGSPISQVNISDCDSTVEDTVSNVCSQEALVCGAVNKCITNPNGEGFVCAHPCYIKRDINGECQAKGAFCLIDSNNNAYCGCEPKYLNIGDDCFHQDIIIIICGASGGFLLLVFVTTIIVLACRLKNANNNRRSLSYGYEDGPFGELEFRPNDLWAKPADSNDPIDAYADAGVYMGQSNSKRSLNSQEPEFGSKHGSKEDDRDSGHDNLAYEDKDMDLPLYSQPYKPQTKEDSSRPIYDTPAPTSYDDSMSKLLASESYKNFQPKLDHVNPARDYSIRRPVVRMTRMDTASSVSGKSDGEEMQL